MAEAAQGLSPCFLQDQAMAAATTLNANRAHPPGKNSSKPRRLHPFKTDAIDLPIPKLLHVLARMTQPTYN